MAARLTHRGPDDSGEWVDENSGLALGFRRLSIIDLSETGHQPMISTPGRFTIAFNGEVYNFEELRKRLLDEGAAPHFRGRSDTEVMLACFEAWGIVPSIQRFIGMFGMAVWDAHERTLHLVRDRLGVKPLYYGWSGDTLLFGSELKALTGSAEFRGGVDRDSVALYARYGYVPAPHTIFRNTYKLLPGTVLSLSTPADRSRKPVPYWSLKEIIDSATKARFDGTAEEAQARVDDLLHDSIRLRMVADVPVGVFLSGGIDSSLIAAVMQRQSSRQVRTFSIGFRESIYDEAPEAAAIAEHLKTAHTTFYVSARDALDVIPRLPQIYDEPFADSSQIPTFLVSSLARSSVTVALSGDGGDELFAGYPRHFLGRRLWQNIERVPPFFRPLAGAALRSVSTKSWNHGFAVAGRLSSSFARQKRFGEKVHQVANAMVSGNPDVLYDGIMSNWRSVVPDSAESRIDLTSPETWPSLSDYTERMMFFDQLSYLPDDILVKVDRASMAASLETREPLLDHRLVEFAWRLPMSFKVRNGQGKWLLRQLLATYLPPALIQKPKVGFGVPIDEWLRGPLRPWAESLLHPKRLEADGFFDAARVTERWHDHLAGRHDWHGQLWIVLMFSAWADEYRQWL